MVTGKATVTSSSGGKRRTTTPGKTSKQSRGGKGPAGSEDYPQAFERLGEARGGVTASRSCREAAAGEGGDGLDSVDPRLPDKFGSRRAYLSAMRSSWSTRNGSGRTDEARRRRAMAEGRPGSEETTSVPLIHYWGEAAEDFRHGRRRKSRPAAGAPPA